MSHFTVLVIGESPEEQLEPYSESIEMPSYKRSLVSEESKASFIKYYTKEEEGAGVAVTASFEELYDKHGEGWNGGSWRKDENGDWAEYSTYNPNAKWDWYSLGGRWTGFFKLKEGAEGALGRPGVFDNEAEEGWVDQAEKKDIDFAGMEEESRVKAEATWDKVYEAIKDTPPADSWDKVRDELFPGDVEAARKHYHDQERVKAFSEVMRGNFFSSLDEYDMPKEEFTRRAVAASYTPFAVLKDGHWYERGEMGWFGMASNEKDNWDEQFQELIKDLPDDTLFSLYDCHI